MALLIFDVDGTLVNSEAIILESQRRTASAHGLVHPGREAGLATVGLSLPEVFVALFGPQAPTAALVQTYKDLFAPMRAERAFDEVLYPQVAETLATLARRPGLDLALATGKSQRGVTAMLDRFGWHGLFRSIVTADDVPSKPDPAMLRKAMADCDATPADSVMIGDSVHDMRMARAAGVCAVAVSWGFMPVAELQAAGAQRVLAHFGEVLTLAGDDARIAACATT